MTAVSTRVNILQIFEELAKRANVETVPDGGYVVEAVPGNYKGMYFGCSATGELALVVETQLSSTPPAPLRLAGLSADFGVQSELADASGVRVVRVSVLRCPIVEQGVGDLFATVCAALTEALREGVTERGFSDEIGRWASLFWRLGQRVETDIVGLVGELALVAGSLNPSLWVAAWHSDPNEVLDFVFPDSRLAVEVKATRGTAREHVISLDQVSGPDLSDRYLASVLVDLNDSGQSVGDLVREISDRLDGDDDRLAFWSVLTKTCGEGLSDVLSRRVESQKAIGSVRLYRIADIPKPEVALPLPDGVRSIKFSSKVDLASAVLLAQIEPSTRI